MPTFAGNVQGVVVQIMTEASELMSNFAFASLLSLNATKIE